MTVPYATALAAASKHPVWIMEFPDHGTQRYVSSKSYPNASSAATAGLIVNDVLTTELDLRTGEIVFGEVEAVLVDEDGGVASFLSTNDNSLRAASVTLKYGFHDVTEANFKSISLLLDDWSRKRAGFSIKLRSALAFLDNPLFEDFEDEGFTLVTSLQQNDTTFDVSGDLDEANWRSSGYVLLTHQETSEVELVEYSSFSVISQNRTTVTIANRRKFSVGAIGKTWPSSTTRVNQAWAYNDDPIDLFLRLATTTTGGGNGPDDAGDGDGLGAMVPSTLIERTDFTTLRDDRLDDRSTPYYDISPINSVAEFFINEFLVAGLRFNIKGDGKISVRRHPDLSSSPTVITSKVLVHRIVEWPRAYVEAENNVRWRYGFSPQRNIFHSNVEEEDTRSQDRYGKSKLRDVDSLGMRGRLGTAFGNPDSGYDSYLQRRAAEYLIEFGNPSEEITIEGFWELQDTEVGTLVEMTHPGVYDLAAGVMGVTDEPFYVTAVERDVENARVRLRLRQRRTVGRPLYIAPNAAPAYGSATAADKQYGYVSPNSGNFGDGGLPYDFGT